jgi:peptidoglycan-associated lipoprotein
MLAVAGCNKKKIATTAPPPPPLPPTVAGDTGGPAPVLNNPPRIQSFTAEPTRVERGQSVTLRWATSDATEVSLDQGLGTVAASGSRTVSPTGATTYVLLARKGNDSDTRSVTVDVITGPTVTGAKPQTSGTNGPREDELNRQLVDVYFDYDMSDVRNDARTAVNTDAGVLKQIFAINPRVTYVIEGHADERGSAEYNLGLSDRRAVVVRDALVQLGIPANRLRTISYGEENPVCRDQTESCWQRNRRAHLAPAQ